MSKLPQRDLREIVGRKAEMEAQQMPPDASTANTELLKAFFEWEEAINYFDIAREKNLSRPYICSNQP